MPPVAGCDARARRNLGNSGICKGNVVRAAPPERAGYGSALRRRYRDRDKLCAIPCRAAQCGGVPRVLVQADVRAHAAMSAQLRLRCVRAAVDSVRSRRAASRRGPRHCACVRSIPHEFFWQDSAPLTNKEFAVLFLRVLNRGLPARSFPAPKI